jgi:transcriptional regulator with XRE-family HTH domain
MNANEQPGATTVGLTTTQDRYAVRGDHRRTPLGREIGRNIAALRRIRGLSGPQLARDLADLGIRMGSSAIWQVEHGRRRVTADELVGLAIAFGVTTDRILFGPSANGDSVTLAAGVTATRAAAWAWALAERPLGDVGDEKTADFRYHSLPFGRRSVEASG